MSRRQTAAVLALASSYLDKPIGNHVAAIGEVGSRASFPAANHLSEREVCTVWALRPVSFQSSARIRIRAPQGLALIEARNIAEAMRAIVQA